MPKFAKLEKMSKPLQLSYLSTKISHAMVSDLRRTQVTSFDPDVGLKHPQSRLRKH